MANGKNGLEGLSGAALWNTVSSTMAMADVETDQRFVFIFLRGGMDGLSAVPAYGDPSFRAVRGVLADEAPGSGSPFDILKLNETFGLHRDLKAMQGLYQQGELLVVHATCHDYRDRSHFDAQDAFDRGAVDKSIKSGWLNRTLQALPTRFRTGRSDVAMGLGPTLPLSLRGDEAVGSWSPPTAPKADPDTLQRLAALYAADAQLGPALTKGLSAHQTR